MKKENFVTLIMGTVGGISFALGICMCLLKEWNAFLPGVILGAAGLVILLAMIVVRRRMQGKAPVKWNKKAVGTVFFAILGALIFGTGLCMTTAFEGLLVPGILTGIVGIVLLLCLIPLCKGFKQR